MFYRGLALISCLALAGACDSDDSEPGNSKASRYAVMTQLASAEEATSYFKTLEAIEPQEVDLETAREFTGTADAWAWDGAVFIAEQESLTITKYELDDGDLVKKRSVAFQKYGLTQLAFWINIFISPTKAYMANGTDEYIVWNPKTMEITGTVPMPKLEMRGELKPFASYTDRSAAIRDGLLYHPFYYTNDDYFEYDQNTSIAVYDIETDKLERVIEAPCPGLDHVTQDEDGNLYFSAWVFSPAGAALLDQPSTCVAKIAPDSDKATRLFDVKDIADGREGGVLRYTGDGKAMLAIFHPEHASEEDRAEVSDVAWGSNWKFVSYDFESQEIVEDETIGWNTGSAYGTTIDGKSYILAASIEDDQKTTIFDITDPADAKPVFDVDGWTMRLVKLE